MDFRPVYRLTVYASDDVTPLAPRAGAPHSNPFQVATAKGITGFQPYLGLPRGRRGQLDPLGHKVDVGAMTFPVLDVRTAGQDNIKRWVTAFAGDPEGRNPLMGARLFCEESVDGGDNWTAFFTGTVTRPGLRRTRLWFELHARDLADRLKTRIFTGPPSPAVSDYAKMPSLMPIGVVEPYGNLPTQDPLPGTFASVSGTTARLTLDTTALPAVDPDGVATIVTRGLWDAIQGTVGVFPQFIKGMRMVVKLTSGPASGQEGEFHVRAALVGGGSTIFASANPTLFPSMIEVQPDPDRGWWKFVAAGIAEVPAADPNHLAMPAAGTECEFWIQARVAPSEDVPLLIDDVHPMRFKRDILAGHFGPLDEDGDPLIVNEHAGFDALIADATWGTSRWLITGPEDLNSFVEESIDEPFNGGYRVDGEGRVAAPDLRPPSGS